MNQECVCVFFFFVDTGLSFYGWSDVSAQLLVYLSSMLLLFAFPNKSLSDKWSSIFDLNWWNLVKSCSHDKNMDNANAFSALRESCSELPARHSLNLISLCYISFSGFQTKTLLYLLKTKYKTLSVIQPSKLRSVILCREDVLIFIFNQLFENKISSLEIIDNPSFQSWIILLLSFKLL